MNKIIFNLVALFSFAGFAQSTIYVDLNAAGTNDGSSWENAYTELPSAFYGASAGDEVWIAGGEYRFPGAVPLSAFSWYVDSLKVYGGFAGGETAIEERDWLANETILSGEAGTVEDIGDNMYSVFWGPVEDGEPINYGLIDGVIIQDGNSRAVGYAYQNSGGGIFMGFYNGRMDFKNCVVRNNRANYGAGVYISGGNGPGLEVNFENCRFTENN